MASYDVIAIAEIFKIRFPHSYKDKINQMIQLREESLKAGPPSISDYKSLAIFEERLTAWGRFREDVRLLRKYIDNNYSRLPEENNHENEVPAV